MLQIYSVLPQEKLPKLHYNLNQINKDVESEPSKINENADDNWIFQMKLSNQAELDDLMTEDGYKKFLDENQH